MSRKEIGAEIPTGHVWPSTCNVHRQVLKSRSPAGHPFGPFRKLGCISGSSAIGRRLWAHPIHAGCPPEDLAGGEHRCAGVVARRDWDWEGDLRPAGARPFSPLQGFAGQGQLPFDTADAAGDGAFRLREGSLYGRAHHQAGPGGAGSHGNALFG